MSSPITQSLDWLYSTQMFGIKLGLEGMTRLLRACDTLYPRARVIHVAGTNGKGSTCAFMESVARAAGYRTGLFTSPHLVQFNERIRVNGEMIPDDDAARLINRMRTLIADWETPPTFFELTLAVAMLWFAEQQAEIIILETGMGGRLDATNAVPKDVAVITPIGLDHTQYLGDSLYDVAGEKAGILAWHRPAIIAPQEPEAMRALHDAAHRMDIDLHVVTHECPHPLGLAGDHQRRNAALALAALQALPHFLCSAEEQQRGLANVRWAGRFDEVRPGLILDGAHNPHAMHVLVRTWKQRFGAQKARCVFAGAADKALDEVLALLSPIVDEWILPPVASPRILPAAEMAEKVRAHSEAPLRLTSTLPEALKASETPTLVCGSFFLLGEASAHLRGAAAAYYTTVQ